MFNPKNNIINVFILRYNLTKPVLEFKYLLLLTCISYGGFMYKLCISYGRVFGELWRVV